MPVATIWARRSAEWLRVVAAKYGQPVVVMARRLRTAHALADEVAIILNDHAKQEAQRLVGAKQQPSTDDTLLDSLIRGHYAEIKAVADAARKREQKATWNALYAAQQGRKP